MITKTIDDYATIKSTDLDNNEPHYKAMRHMRNLQAAIFVARALDRHSEELDGLRLDYKRTQRKIVKVIEEETGLMCVGSELGNAEHKDFEVYVSHDKIKIGDENWFVLCASLHGTCEWVDRAGFVYTYSAGFVRDFAEDDHCLDVTADDMRAEFRKVPDVAAEYRRILGDANDRIEKLFSGDFRYLTGYYAPTLASFSAYIENPYEGRKYV